MGRIRTIKPEFFVDEELFDLEKQSRLPIRLAYAGLWTQVDREGRFEWRPRTLKAAILPHDRTDFEKILGVLEKSGMIERYSVDGREYGWIRSWKHHQVINNKERPSVIPPSPGEANLPFALSTRDTEDNAFSARETNAKDNPLSTRSSREDNALPSRDERVTQGKERKEGNKEPGTGTAKTQDTHPPTPRPGVGLNDLSLDALSLRYENE
jgi:hypothetical protein